VTVEIQLSPRRFVGYCVLAPLDLSQPGHVTETGFQDGLKNFEGIDKFDMKGSDPAMCILEQYRLLLFNLWRQLLSDNSLHFHDHLVNIYVSFADS